MGIEGAEAVEVEALGRLVAHRTGEHGEHVRAMAQASQPRPAAAPAAPTDRLGLARHVFEGHDVPTLTIAGQDLWIATDVGRVLDYGREGKGLPDMLAKEWAAEFLEGEHVVVARGDILRDLKGLLNQQGDTPLVSPKTAQLTLLTRAGLWLVLDKTEKPVGQRFRRWLSGEVRQAAEEGRAAHPPRGGESGPLHILIGSAEDA